MRAIFSTTVVVLFLAALAYFGLQSLISDQGTTVETEIGNGNDLTGKVLGLRILDKNDLGEVLKLSAKEAIVSEELTAMKDIKAVFASKKHKAVEISSNAGEYMSETKNALFTGNVKVKSEESFLLKTENLRFVADKRILKTDLYVEYVADGTKITGKGMVIEIDTHNVTILNSVNAKFN